MKYWMDSQDTSVRRQLKILLYQLAAQSESPAADLQELVEEVIEELYKEVEEASRKKRHLHLVESALLKPKAE